MNFTDGEMVFMNSITNEKKLYGLRFITPGIINENSYIKDTIQELKKKNIINKEEKLSEEGIICSYIFEEFKSSKNRLIINNIQIALMNESDCAICLIRNGNNSNEIIIVKRDTLLLKLITDCAYLRKKTEDNLIQEKSIENQQWCEDIKKFEGDIISVEVIQEEKKKCEKVFYWNEKNGYEYDVRTKKERIATPQYIRIFLMKELGIDLKNMKGA